MVEVEVAEEFTGGKEFSGDEVSVSVELDVLSRSTPCTAVCMSTPVPTRFSEDELAMIDQLVDQGVADSRSAVIRQGVHHLVESVRRALVGETIAASYRELPQTDDDNELAMANAMAMTEAESW